jgi:hypothetical protein
LPALPYPLAMGDDRANASIDRLTAPDGSILVERNWVEWFNTHWVRSPRVIEIATGRVLLDLWGTDWDAEVAFPRDGAVLLGLRRYRVRGWLDAEIDLHEHGYRIEERPGEISQGPLDAMPAALETAYARVATTLPQAAMAAPVPPLARPYVIAILILIGALIAIAAATFVVEHFRARPAQHLDKIPPMPAGIPR